MSKDVNNSADVLDARDVIVRRDELQAELDAFAEEDVEQAEKTEWLTDYGDELKALNDFIDEGSDEWRNGCTLIRESYLKDYAEELASELYGKEVAAARWPFNCINWEQAAFELQQDYTSADFSGVTYLYKQ